MSGSLATGRRRRKRRLRQRAAREEDSDPMDLALPLEVEISESSWCRQEEQRTARLTAAATASSQAAAELSPDGRDDVSQAEFLGVRAALQQQTDLGLHFNEKGNQICQLSWADFSQRVPPHWTEKHPNVCPLCKKKLSSRFSLSRHYIDVHHREEKKLPPPAPCRFCSKILYNQSTLNRHVLTVHKERASEAALSVAAGAGAAGRAATASDSSPAATPPAHATGYYCGLCQQRHQRKAEVTRHMQLLQLQGSAARQAAGCGALVDSSWSAEESGSAPEASDGPLISPSLTGSRSYEAVPAFPCSVCTRTFAGQERLIAHLAGHLRENHTDTLPSGLCPLCELTVPQLASHIRDAHCRVCARCGLILPEALMERHLTAHDLKMAFWCPVCGQREDRRQKMMQHISDRHEYIAEGSQFQCGSCGHIRSHNLVTHCLKHARDDALTAYWFKTDVLSPLEQRGLEAGRLLRSCSSEDASLQWLPVAAAEPAAAAAVSVHLLQACDGVPGAGLDAAALLSAALCPVCAAPTPSGRQLGAHLQRHGELPILFCPGCPRTFCRPVRARRHRCGRLLCLLCGLQVLPAHVATHWALHAGDDPVCALLTPRPPQEGHEDGSVDSDEEPPCGLLERQLARQLAGFKQEPAEIGDEDGVGEVPVEVGFANGEAETRDGEDEVGDGEEGIRGGKDEIRDGKNEIGNGEEEIRDGKDKVRNGKGKIGAEADVCDGELEIRDGTPEIRDEEKELPDKDAKPELENAGVAETGAGTNGTTDSPKKTSVEEELKNGMVRERNGVIEREFSSRPDKRGVDGRTRSQTAVQKGGCESSESTEAGQSNASDESSHIEKAPTGDKTGDALVEGTPDGDTPDGDALMGDAAVGDAPTGDTPIENVLSREARSERRSPPRKRRRSLSSGSRGGGSSSPGDHSDGRSPSSTFRSGARAESAESDSESESLACDLCPRRLRSVSQLRRHRLYRHGEWRGPLRCARCPRRFFLAAHRRLHVCAGADAAGGARPCCGRCGAEPAAGRPACLVSAAGRRLRLTVCARCDCPLPGPDSDGGDRASGGGSSSQPSPPTSLQGAAVCGECDAPLAAGAAALLQEEGAAETPGPAAARLCIPCAEHRLAAEPRLAARLWRPEATLGALWCPSCCQPQVSLHQLRLHSLRQHTDLM